MSIAATQSNLSMSISRRTALSGIAALCASVLAARMLDPASTLDSPKQLNDDEIDALLQRAAEAALGSREGTLIAMNPRDGRIRAIVNPSAAFEETFAPGSTIKPFTIIAAMGAGFINSNSRLLCRERYRRGDFEISCSHPVDLPPFTPADALAYSCNYFFGKVGEHLNEDAFNHTLSSFGFGVPLETAQPHVAGTLPHGPWQSRNALGEGRQLLVTPVELLSAYAALVNGGHVWTPIRENASRFKASDRSLQPEITDTQWNVLMRGMRSAVDIGTAAQSGLSALPLNIIGKTGTSTAKDSSRTQGWFVGFAGTNTEQRDAVPFESELAVLVFFKHGHGADCAAAARPVFEEFARMGSRGERGARGRGDIEQVAASVRLGSATLASAVRVRIAREDEPRTMALEDYVLGVVRAEGSIEDEDEALKALAVTARVYAMKNMRRHGRDGFDFCTTTHCQRFMLSDRDSVREQVLRGVNETAGESLRDESGSLIDSYFSASCGGMTADISTLWGVAPKTYLRGTRDQYCQSMPHSDWTDVISTERLTAALNSDARTIVGGSLRDLIISTRDQTGRAEFVTIVGDSRKSIRGWDFKLIVGRALGWNLLKSSRFEINRHRDGFAFHGSGFGHGLGLCQEGAHVMAQRGSTYKQILARYFPGTSIVNGNSTRSAEAA